MRGQQRGRGRGKKEERGKRKESRSVTPRMGCTTRYRPRCTNEKTKKREAPVKTSAETSSAGRSRAMGAGGGGEG